MTNLAPDRSTAQPGPAFTFEPCAICGRPIIWAWPWSEGKRGAVKVAIDQVAAGAGSIALSADMFGGHGEIPYCFDARTKTQFRKHRSHKSKGRILIGAGSEGSR